MARVAYADEYPWVRCQCGRILNSDPGACAHCGEDSEVEYLDRFGPPSNLTGDTTHYGRKYRNVAYEDRFRATSPF